LVENDLNETLGVNTPLGFRETVYMPYGYDDEDAKGNPVRRMHYFRLDGSPVDWDRDGVQDRSGPEVSNNDLNYAGPDAPVGGLNTPEPNQVLASYNDWASIQLAIPGAQALAGAQLPQHEPPPAPVLVAWLNANIPNICHADIVPNGTVDADDLVAVVLAWGCTNPPGPCPADINNSGVVDADDLVAVILAWGDCP
jgi:hypothetical protein